MRTNTPDVVLRSKTTEQIQSEYDAVVDILLNESFGYDNEARYELMDERSQLFKELKRRRG
jgi:hypothetical protein